MAERKALRQAVRQHGREKLRSDLKIDFWLSYAKLLGIVGLALVISAASGVAGWGGTKLYTDIRTKQIAKVKITGPFGELLWSEANKIQSVTLQTSMGNIDLALDFKNAPVTSANFVVLAKQGFYDGVKFHRVIKDFMIQSGDPNSKGDNVANYGTGGPGYTLKDELTGKENYLRGAIAMANAGPNTGGSQFFIVQKDQPTLPKSYPIFGKVIAGMEVVDKIAAVAVKDNGSGEKSLPVKPVIINKVVINNVP